MRTNDTDQRELKFGRFDAFNQLSLSQNYELNVYIWFYVSATVWILSYARKMVHQNFFPFGAMTEFPVCLFSGCYDIFHDVIILGRASVKNWV